MPTPFYPATPPRHHAGRTLRSAGWDGVAPALVVSGTEQRLHLLGADQNLDWPISTALAGFGNRQDSGQTPVGLHRISECIGEGAPCGMVFKGRVATGEIIPDLTQPGGDFITTRILWLEGLEAGINQGPGIDSHDRYIYIHGTPYTTLLGQPVSAGCIRMDNRSIQALFQHVQPGKTLVLIAPHT